MTAEQTPSHADQIAASLGDPAAGARFTAARLLLRQHLLVRREIPNGRDFLFSASPPGVLEALKELVAIEHRASRFLLFDYARIEDYFLLRVVGGTEYTPIIETYFD